MSHINFYMTIFLLLSFDLVYLNIFPVVIGEKGNSAFETFLWAMDYNSVKNLVATGGEIKFSNMYPGNS